MNIQHPPAGRLMSLPKWAGTYIGVLRRRIEELEKQIRDDNAPIEDGEPRIVLRPFNDVPNVIEPSTTIRYELGGDWQNSIDVRIEDGRIRIHGIRQIQIQPSASNVLDISLHD